MSPRAAPRPVSVELSPDLAARVTVGQAAAAPVVVSEAGPGLVREMQELERDMRRAFEGLAPAQIGDLAPARELYRAFGIDPTKTRPSSEALLRRVLRGKSLPLIFNAVDVCNLLAMRFLLPIGLYDRDKIQGPVLLRAGGAGEAYQGIRKDEVHLEGRPVLADELGAFGNPTSDSLRTSVTEGTSELCMVVFAPASYSADRMTAHVEHAAESMARHLAPDGCATRSGLIPPG